MQSRPHDLWAWFFSSTLEDRLRYAPSDCFRTFPFPVDTSSNLQAAGQAYHDHRAALMIARNEGMTKTYNRFHDPAESAEDITRLRELHAEMDRAVLYAYGWSDLAASAEPVFLDDTNEDDHTYQGRFFWPSASATKFSLASSPSTSERAAAEREAGIEATDHKDGNAVDDDGEEE